MVLSLFLPVPPFSGTLFTHYPLIHSLYTASPFTQPLYFSFPVPLCSFNLQFIQPSQLPFHHLSLHSSSFNSLMYVSSLRLIDFSLFIFSLVCLYFHASNQKLHYLLLIAVIVLSNHVNFFFLISIFFPSFVYCILLDSSRLQFSFNMHFVTTPFLSHLHPPVTEQPIQSPTSLLSNASVIYARPLFPPFLSSSLFSAFNSLNPLPIY